MEWVREVTLLTWLWCLVNSSSTWR